MWSPLDYPCSKGPENNDCDPYCVFDIVQDPSERHNLAKEQPELLNELLSCYNKYGQEPKSFRIKAMIQVKLFQMIPTLVNLCKRKKATGAHGQKKIDHYATINRCYYRSMH
uniref:Sulfatase N-terminal domain-containing protein n=1 Tax=Amphimedon queenslandica TaxID=400682 RepID=A0A1X7V869_AMPQE